MARVFASRHSRRARYVSRGCPGVCIHLVCREDSETTPMQTDEFVVPTFGYGMCVMTGYRESVLLINVKMPTPVVSNCQYATCVPSGLQRNASRTPSSSS